MFLLELHLCTPKMVGVNTTTLHDIMSAYSWHQYDRYIFVNRIDEYMNWIDEYMNWIDKYLNWIDEYT